MMRYRNFALILAVCLALSLLAGCGSSVDPEGARRGDAAAEKKLLAVYRYENDASSETYTFEYDDAGQLREQVWQYTGGAAWRTSYEFDDRGRMLGRSTRMEGAPEGADPVEERFAYDAQGRVTEHTHLDEQDIPVTDTYIYEGERIARMERQTDALKDVWDYTYREDEAGNLITMRTRQRGSAAFPETTVAAADGTPLQSYSTIQGRPVILYTYDTPLLWVRGEELAIPYNAMNSGTRQYHASLLDAAGNEIFETTLGDMSFTRLYTDAEGYLIRAESVPFDESSPTVTTRFVYGMPGEDPETLLQQPDAAAPEPRPLTDAEVTELLSGLPENFIFSSGAGGWMTEFTIAPDGTFSGSYYDSDMGVTGPDYPNGSCYVCTFSGVFTDFKQISDTEYSLQMASVTTEHAPGETYIEDGVKYTYAAPYGFEKAQELRLYLPGTPASSLPDGFLSWVRLSGTLQPMPEGLYGLYNVNEELGMYALSADSIAKDYRAEIQGNEIELWTSELGSASLSLRSENNRHWVTFTLTAWEDTALVTTDLNAENMYLIALSPSADRQTVELEVTVLPGTDLSPWGGTADGHLRTTLTLAESEY